MEGDSRLIINMLSKLQWGSSPSKIFAHWQLETLIDLLSSIVHRIFALVPSHVKRDANKVVDILTNASFSKPLVYVDSS